MKSCWLSNLAENISRDVQHCTTHIWILLDCRSSMFAYNIHCNHFKTVCLFIRWCCDCGRLAKPCCGMLRLLPQVVCAEQQLQVGLCSDSSSLPETARSE